MMGGGCIVEGVMVKVVDAEYDADARSLRLEEPLDGVANREKVKVTVETASDPNGEPSWMKFRGIWSKEEGEDFARAVEEMFPPWNADE